MFNQLRVNVQPQVVEDVKVQPAMCPVRPENTQDVNVQPAMCQRSTSSLRKCQSSTSNVFCV